MCSCGAGAGLGDAARPVGGGHTSRWWSTVTWRWDVALSFAGAQRGYVEQVAAELEAAGVRCFYDAHRRVELWGRHLAEELPRVYAEDSAVVVVFVSADYAARDWTNLERRAALGRAVRERREYVLPARFDDTELPGVLEDLVAIDLRTQTPQEFAGLILAKLADLGIVPPSGHDTTRQSHKPKIRKIRRRKVPAHITAIAAVGLALLFAALTFVSEPKKAAVAPTVEQLSVLAGATHYRVRITINNTTSEDQLITKIDMSYNGIECDVAAVDSKIYLIGDRVSITHDGTGGAGMEGSVFEGEGAQYSV